MTINAYKTKIMHFRGPSVERSKYVFTCCQVNIEYTDRYRYLGFVLTEQLNYHVTAKYVANSATRALGLLVSKYKALGKMPYEVFTKLYDIMV